MQDGNKIESVRKQFYFLNCLKIVTKRALSIKKQSLLHCKTLRPQKYAQRSKIISVSISLYTQEIILATYVNMGPGNFGLYTGDCQVRLA